MISKHELISSTNSSQTNQLGGRKKESITGKVLNLCPSYLLASQPAQLVWEADDDDQDKTWDP